MGVANSGVGVSGDSGVSGVGVAGVTSVEEARVGLGLSVDGGHEGAKNNLRNR